MKVEKEIYEFITWDTPAHSVVSNVEATILNGNLNKIKFTLNPASASGNASAGRRQNFELNFKNADQNTQAVRKLHEIFGDLLDFMDGKPMVEKTQEGRKRMIQIRDVKTTFGDGEAPF